MPRRDRSPEAVAREWWMRARDAKQYIGTPLPDGLLVLLFHCIKANRRAERARVRRIVRRELATWEREGDPPCTALQGRKL